MTQRMIKLWPKVTWHFKTMVRPVKCKEEEACCISVSAAAHFKWRRVRLPPVSVFSLCLGPLGPTTVCIRLNYPQVYSDGVGSYPRSGPFQTGSLSCSLPLMENSSYALLNSGRSGPFLNPVQNFGPGKTSVGCEQGLLLDNSSGENFKVTSKIQSANTNRN